MAPNKVRWEVANIARGNSLFKAGRWDRPSGARFGAQSSDGRRQDVLSGEQPFPVFGRYLGRNTGFVLWIVPNEAIYSQTLRHLSDRQHPYRQALDRTAAGRVQILEKADRLDARDIDNQLCVMLLMLQSANRDTQDSLKMFQDRGDVHGFFP